MKADIMITSESGKYPSYNALTFTNDITATRRCEYVKRRNTNTLQSQRHFTADSQSVCLGAEPTLWTFDQILLPFQVFGSKICCLVSVGRPL
jgi:hypothetical protein